MPGLDLRTPNAKLILLRVLAAVGCSVFVAFSLACMSVQIGGRHETTTVQEGTELQTGTVTVPSGTDIDVYYPSPYTSPPNLTIEASSCTVAEQKADHFRMHNSSAFSHEVTWKARGQKSDGTVSTQTSLAPPGAAGPVLDPTNASDAKR